MRINLHPEGVKNLPKWVELMINEFVEEFRKEYSVSHGEVYRYFFSNNLERIQKLFDDNNIKVDTYNMVDLSSRGIIIPDNDPTVVFYKLKYTAQAKES